jgi:hypothetical protein
VANRLTASERAAMLQIARCEAHATERHRKLAHLLGREQGVFVFPSSMLRLLREHDPVQWRGGGRARKPRPGREELDLDGPNQLWAWDLSYIPIGSPRRFWFLVGIVDACSRKLVGHGSRGHRHVGQGPGRRGLLGWRTANAPPLRRRCRTTGPR